MTAHSSLADNLIADFEIQDPGSSATSPMIIDKTPATLSINRTGAVQFAAPEQIGMEITISNRTGAGTVVINAPAGRSFQVASRLICTLSADAGAFATFLAIELDGVKTWRYYTGDGATLS